MTFLFDLCLMWLLVEQLGANMVLAAGTGFLAANTLHYVVGRDWVFRGTKRAVASGLGYFLVNAAIGLALTISLFAALISWTPLNYVVARVLVSIVAGLVMFVLNAVFNFKQL